MIILSRQNYRILTLTALVLILGQGGLTYFTLTSLPGTAPEEIQFQAERLLFTALTGAVLFLGLLFVLRAQARRRMHSLDNLFTARRSGDTDPELWEQRLGPLGQRFLDYNQGLLTVSRQRARKIDGLSSLVRILLHNSPHPLAVINLQGTLLYASPAFYQRTGGTSTEMLQTPLDRHFPSLPPNRLVLEIQRTAGPLSLELKNHPKAKALPVQDTQDQTAYILLSLTETGDFSLPATRQTPSSSGTPSGTRSRTRSSSAGNPGPFRRVFQGFFHSD